MTAYCCHGSYNSFEAWQSKKRWQLFCSRKVWPTLASKLLSRRPRPKCHLRTRLSVTTLNKHVPWILAVYSFDLVSNIPRKKMNMNPVEPLKLKEHGVKHPWTSMTLATMWCFLGLHGESPQNDSISSLFPIWKWCTIYMEGWRKDSGCPQFGTWTWKTVHKCPVKGRVWRVSTNLNEVPNQGHHSIAKRRRAVLVVGWGDCWCRGESSLPKKTLGVIKEAEDEGWKNTQQKWIVSIKWLFDGGSKLIPF